MGEVLKKYLSLIVALLILGACAPLTPTAPRLLAIAPDANDISLDAGKTYSNYTVSVSGTADNPVTVYGNGATVKCLTVKSDYVVVDNVTATGCSSHGILVTGKHVTIQNSIVYGNVTENGTGPCPGTGNWGSGIKGAVGAEYLTVRYNTVYANCGEGIALTRVIGGEVDGNTVYDNFSVNIYIDNSNGVSVHDNRTGCADSRYYRNGSPARGITLAAEYYSGWGFQFRDVMIERNYIEKCGGPRWYSPRFPSDKGTNVTVRDNLFSDVPPPLVSLPTWVTVSNNVAVTGPTPTAGPTRTPTMTFTPAPPTATRTVTPTRTPTATPSLVAITPTLECYDITSVGGEKVRVCFP